MMPVIRISDATFVDLKSVSTWLGTNTPSETIERIVQEKMQALDLERDVEHASEVMDTDGQELVFDKTPGLAHTRVVSATIAGNAVDKPNWAGLLIRTIKFVKTKGLVGEKLAMELQIPAKASKYDEKGYTFYPDLGISIQGQSAPDAWKEVSRLANKFSIPIEVRFQWHDKDKAQHPGKIGRIRAGK